MGMYAYLQYSPTAHAVGMTLLHFVWQGLAVALVLGMVLTLLKRSRPQVRYLVSCLALLLMFLMPVSTFGYLFATSDFKGPPVIPSRVYALLEKAQARAEAEEAARTAELVQAVLVDGAGAVTAANPGGAVAPTVDGVTTNTSEETVPSPVPEDAEGFSIEIPWDKIYAFFVALAPWFSVFWGFGVALFTARLFGALYFSSRLRRRDAAVIGGQWQETVDRLRERLGIHHAVTVLQSARVMVPTMVGWLRPVILLPASALTGLTPGQLEALLAHELAHIRRHDYLINLLQNVVETLLFYHPAVWWVSKQIRDDRELCCDDMVLEVCGDARVYAQALSDMLTLRMEESPVALAASGGSLPNRLRRMLGIAPPATGRMSRGVASTIVVALVLTASTFLAMRAAAAREIDPEALERFQMAVSMKETSWELNWTRKIDLLQDAIEILDNLAREYPDVDEYRGELGVTMYEVVFGQALSDEEKLEVLSHALEVLEPVAEKYETNNIAREYRYYVGRCYDRSVKLLSSLQGLSEVEAIEMERRAVETLRSLVEVEPDNPVWHRFLAQTLRRLGDDLIGTGEPRADITRKGWEHYLRGELLGARYDSLYYTMRTNQEEIRDGRHWIGWTANKLRNNGRTDEAVETYEMALASFAPIVEEDPQFYGDLITVRREYEGFLKEIGRATDAERLAAETDALRERLSNEDPDFFRTYRNMQTGRFRDFRGAMVDYKVRIATPGDYQLHLRLEAHDAKSCCVLACIDELADGLGGSVPDMYRVSCEPDMDHDFATNPWTSTGQFENAGDNVPVVWSIPAAGDYTLRLIGIEDGAAVDTLVFQRKDLPGPEGNDPAESQQTATGAFLENGGQVTVEAEHFADRNMLIMNEMGGEWLAVPAEAAGDIPHANARGDAYIQVLPDKTPTTDRLLQLAESGQGNAQIWQALADAYSERGEFNKVLDVYNRTIEREPNNAKHWWQRAEYYIFSRKEYELGLADNAKALELNPDDSHFWNQRGLAHWYLGQYAEAADSFGKAHELDPENQTFLLNHVSAHTRLGQFDKADEDLTKWVEREPENDDTWYERGLLYVKFGRFADAARDFAQNAELSPNDAYDWYITALAQLASGDLQAYRSTCASMVKQFSATQDLEPAHWTVWTSSLAPQAVADVNPLLELAERVLQRSAANTHYAQSLAVALYRADRLDDALPRLQAVADIPPPNTSPAYSWFFLAMAHSRLGHDEEAQAWLQKAKDQAGSEMQGGASWNRNVTLHLLWQEAESFINERALTETGPDIATGLGLESDASSFEQQGQYAKAVETWGRLIQLDPGNGYYWRRRGQARLGSEEFDEALEDFSRWVELEPASADARFSTGLARLKTGETDAALEDFDKAIAWTPDDQGRLLNRAEELEKLGQLQVAILCWNRLVDLDPANVNTWLERGRIRAKLGRFDEALLDFRKAVELGPDSIRGWNYAAMAQLAMGDIQAYRATCAETVERFGATKDPSIARWVASACVSRPDTVSEWSTPLRLAQLAEDELGSRNFVTQTLGAALYRAGRYDEGIAVLESELSEGAVAAFAGFFLAMAHEKLGHADVARQWFDQAVTWANEPGDNRMWHRLITLQSLRKEAETLLGRTAVASTGS